MSWVKDLGIFGGATAGLALLIAVAAQTSTVAGATAGPVSVASTSALVTASNSSSGAPASADSGPWTHGIVWHIAPRLATTAAVAPTAIVAATPVQNDPPVEAVAAVEPAAVVAIATPVVVAAPATLAVHHASSVLGMSVPGVVRQWEPFIDKYASQNRLDPNLVAAVMMTESGGNAQATSNKGAIGLMQVVNGSYDPDQNVAEGTRILSVDLSRFGGDLELTLAAYNAGAGAVDQFKGIPPYVETETYVYQVLNRYYLYAPAA